MKEGSHKRPHFTCFYVCEMSRIGKSIEVESRLVIARVWGERGLGSECPWVLGFFVGWWKYSGIIQWWRSHNFVQTPKTIEMYTDFMVVNYISIKNGKICISYLLWAVNSSFNKCVVFIEIYTNEKLEEIYKVYKEGGICEGSSMWKHGNNSPNFSKHGKLLKLMS